METKVLGNKAIYLERLRKWGFRVPPFAVLPIGLSREAFEQETRSMLKKSSVFAVRSSTYAEDSEKEAKAGQYYSALGVRREELYDAYQEVAASYQENKGGVIIQHFVPTEVAGVLFTRDGQGDILVNSNRGLCKSVVEGLSCDEWRMDRKGKLKQQVIPKKKKYFQCNGEAIVEGQSSDKSLTKRQLRQLASLAKKVESLSGAPQDVEWGFYKDALYVLQTRPITRAIPPPPRLVHYDSANIAESYSGIVLPLTLSFASRVYRIVYRNLVHYSGVSWKKINRHALVFENMLAWFHGRLYYNMNNWYVMTSFLPGYRRNKKNLEQMITGNIREEIEETVMPSLTLKIAYPFIVLAKILAMPFTRRRFKRGVEKYIAGFRQKDLAQLDAAACKREYADMESKLIQKWHIPVENDFMVMTYFGLLKKRLDEESLNHLLRFESKSTRQINELINIKNMILHTPLLANLWKEGKDMELLQEPWLKQLMKEYFMKYGGRFANELKLESIDLEEDPGRFLELLKLYADYKIIEPEGNGELPGLGWLDRYLVKQFKKYASIREEMRLLRSNCFSLARKLFNRLGQIHARKGLIENPVDIFYLSMEEAFQPGKGMKSLIRQRKKEYLAYEKQAPLPYFSASNGQAPLQDKENFPRVDQWKGRGCAPGIVKGKVKVMKEYSMPNPIDFDILVTDHTDPGWTPLIGLVKGLIVEHGGILSHAAIVARELGIPTVVGVGHAMKTFRTGQVVELDGNTGIITRLHGT
jgi:pyruvate,water dikinase